MNNIKILIILLLIILLLKKNKKINKNIIIKYLKIGLSIYVSICLLTNKTENFTMTNYRQNLKTHLGYLKEELSEKRVIISDEKRNEYTCKIIYNIDSDKIIDMCIGNNKYNIFNNVSNMCPTLEKYLNSTIHIFNWNIETKLGNTQDITRNIRKLPDNCTFMQQNLELSKIDFSCKYYHREGGYVDALDCNQVDNSDCKVNDSSTYRTENILKYKLSIPQNTILIVYYYKAENYIVHNNDYDNYEDNKKGITHVIKPYSIILIDKELNNTSISTIIKNHKFKYNDKLETIIDENYFPNTYKSKEDIIKYIAGFKFININITNYDNWNNFKNNNNILKLKENLYSVDENQETQINYFSKVVENKTYDYIENNKLIQRKQKKKENIFKNSFIENCPS